MYGGKENNIRMLTIVAAELKELRQQVVFVGGCATALLVTDSAAPDIRHTLDVDFIVDVISLREFNLFEKRLHQLGFQQSLSGNDPICRWHKNNIIIDVMPSDEKILGFTNKWYKETVKHAAEIKLANNITVKMASAPYFLATKLEAFKHRGANDFLASHDLEDIIAVIDGRSELREEIAKVQQKLRLYLAKEFKKLLDNYNFIAALPGHLNYGEISNDRADVIHGRIKQIAQFGVANSKK